MKQRRAVRGFVTTGIGLITLLFMTHATFGLVLRPTVSRGLDTWLTRAMDPCVLANDGAGPTVTVLNTANVPSYGCLQENAVTDASLGLSYGRLIVNDRGQVVLLATGLTVGDKLKIRLTVRVTRKVTTVKHPPGANTQVTFSDIPITCPDSSPARPNGLLVQHTDLGTCFGPDKGLVAPGSNVEVLDAVVLNAANSKPYAVPGVAKR